MRKTSLQFTSKKDATYSGNEPMTAKAAVKYGAVSYEWNERFVNLIDAFLEGLPVHNITDTTHDLIEKYVSYANGTLSSNDKQYDLIEQFDNYLSTQGL